jgi:hypothetical protein
MWQKQDRKLLPARVVVSALLALAMLSGCAIQQPRAETGPIATQASATAPVSAAPTASQPAATAAPTARTQEPAATQAGATAPALATPSARAPATATAAPTARAQEANMTIIYAKADWYQLRPEAEQVWKGTLQENSAPVGPGGRGGLDYSLATDDTELLVYAPDGGPLLAPFVGRSVVVRGKLVDLRNEGLGQELWIAAIGMSP